MPNSLPEYTNKAAWNEIMEQFSLGKRCFGQEGDIEYHLWKYFKICLKQENRFFFSHSLLPFVESCIQRYIWEIPKGKIMYRARIDKDHKLADGFQNFIQRIYEYKDAQFQGFDAVNSGAPSADLVGEGRCNPKGVAYLYTALDEHTAVAEVRPIIDDIISVAEITPKRNLRLVNFNYDPCGIVWSNDFLLNHIRREFNRINREKTDDYIVTQYITAYIEHLGYDGLCFRSSLVKDGVNFVIFNPENCTVLSSKLRLLDQVTYNFGQFNE